MPDFFTPDALSALFQVIMIDLVLAGDNAIVIGLAAAGLPSHQRTKVILVGIVAATVLRIGFAGVTTQLLQIIGLLLAGGILLLWVCWKMWRELRNAHAAADDDASACRRRPAHQQRWHLVCSRAAQDLRRQPPGRSSSPTCRCPSTTCWRWRAPHATTPRC